MGAILYKTIWYIFGVAKRILTQSR